LNSNITIFLKEKKWPWWYNYFLNNWVNASSWNPTGFPGNGVSVVFFKKQTIPYVVHVSYQPLFVLHFQTLLFNFLSLIFGLSFIPSSTAKYPPSFSSAIRLNLERRKCKIPNEIFPLCTRFTLHNWFLDFM